jgi:predicted aspartyl protease
VSPTRFRPQRRHDCGRRIVAALAALWLLLAAAGAAVAACPAPRRLGAVPLIFAANVPLVPVRINGRPALLTLDTGAERTVLTPAAAARLGIPQKFSFARPMHGIAGAVGGGEIALNSFTAGAVALRRVGIVVGPITLREVAGRMPDGLLGVDTLADFDLDLDLPNSRLTFYSRQNCLAATPDWHQRWNRIATGDSLHRHLFFPVTLDGRRLVAFFDTGSQISVISTPAALASGVSAVTLAHDPARVTRGVADESLVSHVHRFARLRIGDETLRDPVLTVAGVHFDNESILLGSDFLASRRAWFSYGSRQVFLWQVP